MSSQRRTPVPDWLWRLKKGDVILWGRNRRPRVVREFKLGKSAGKTTITFVIQRCSWTKRCYTVVNLNDALYAGIEQPPMPVHAKMATELDAKINYAIETRDRTLTCCAVHGVA